MHIAPFDIVVWHVWLRVEQLNNSLVVLFAVRSIRFVTLVRRKRIVRTLLKIGPSTELEIGQPRPVVFPNQYLSPSESVTCALYFQPELRRDYPLNLSISVSGGKETNRDSRSNGE